MQDGDLRERLRGSELLLVPEYVLGSDGPARDLGVLVANGEFREIAAAAALVARHPHLAPVHLARTLLMPGFVDATTSDAVVRQGARVRRAVGDLPPHLGAAGERARRGSSTSRRSSPRSKRCAADSRRCAMPARARRRNRRGGACRAGNRRALRARFHLQRRGARRATGPRSCAGRTLSWAASTRSADPSFARGLDPRGRERRDARAVAARCARGRRDLPDPRQRAPRVGRALARRARPAAARAPRPAGALGPQALVAHAMLVTPEMNLLRDSDTAVSYNPVASHGKATRRRPALMAALGIRFGLGTDGTRSDGFRLMDAGEATQRLASACRAATSSCGGGWLWLDPATAGGADAAGLGRVTGGIAPGSRPISCSSISTCRS